MSNVSVFQQGGAPTKRGLSELGKAFASVRTSRRIQTNTNGTFKKLINNEQSGDAVRGELKVIIVGALPKISRVYFDKPYVMGEKTPPTCWSNLGDKPEALVTDKQHTTCADCKNTIKDSAALGKGKACKYQRRISILLEGDSSGDVYQFNIPGKSLFGTGVSNVHPFESYMKYLASNSLSPDNIVTNIFYDSNADSMELLFTPVRNTTDEEDELVREAMGKPETQAYTKITVFQSDKPISQPVAIEAKEEDLIKKILRREEPEDEEVVEEPVKRQSKKVEPSPKIAQNLADVVTAWGGE